MFWSSVMLPNNVHMNCGNHEAELANEFHGFFGELRAKYATTSVANVDHRTCAVVQTTVEEVP